jgi:hypothetical protein
VSIRLNVTAVVAILGFPSATDAAALANSQPARCSAVYERAARLLDQADAAARSHEYARANRDLNEGLRVLGFAYYDAQVLDDSSLNLAIARSNANKGRLSLAAGSRRGVLSGRLRQCHQKRKGKKRPSQGR